MGKRFDFLKEVLNSPATEECIDFPFPVNNKGYGSVSVGNIPYQAHTLVRKLHEGVALSEKIQGNHTCHNTKCVNPEHVYLGTQSENIRDIYARGNAVGRNGQTVEQQDAIKRLLEMGVSQDKVALAFGITQGAVSHIKHRMARV